MAFWNDISRFAGNLTGGLVGESDEERKKKEQLKQQAQANARAQSVANASNKTSGSSVTTRPTSAVTPQATRPTINNQAVSRYTKKQRDDRGFDFYDGDRKVSVDDYVRGTGEDRNKLTREMADAGDVVSAKTVLDTVKGGLFRDNENTIRTRAQKVVDDRKRADEDQEKQQIKSLYDSDFQLSGKKIGVKNYVDQYGGADAWRQQKIRDELTREAQDGNQESALLLATIDQTGNSKFDLGQKATKLGVDVISGLQRGVTTVADTGLMAGGVIGSIGKNDEELVKHVDDIQKQRDVLKQMNAIDGFALNDKKDFEWTGDPVKDAANLAGRSLDVGLSATMFANPAAVTRQGAMGGATRQAVGTILRDSAFFGTADAAQGGLSTYGETGDINQALASAAQTGLTSAVTQGSLGATGLTAGAAYNKLKDRFRAETVAKVEAQTGQKLTEPEIAELDGMVEAEMQNRGVIKPLDEVELPAIAERMDEPTQTQPVNQTVDGQEVTPGFDNATKRANDLFGGMDARERFSQPRDMGMDTPEARALAAEQEIAGRIAQLPDENYIAQMADRFGMTPAAVQRLLTKTNKAELFRVLNNNGENIKGANNPDAYATSIINGATDAGKQAAARAGVELGSDAPATDPVVERVRKMSQEGANPQEMTQAIAEEYGAATGGQTTLDSEGRLVDTTNGEIVFDPATDLAAIRDMEENSKYESVSDDWQPEDVNAPFIAEATRGLPDSRKATAADIPQIKQVQNGTMTQIDNFAANTTPEQRTNLMKEIAEHERSGADISPEAKAMYDEYIRPVVDSLYDKSRRAGDMGRKQYYLPEEMADTPAPTERKFGNTWADEANMEFGHSMRREGKIDTTDLNDPAEALKNYTQQWYQDNYGHLTPENIAEAQGRGAVDGGAYLTGRRNIAEKLDESMVRSLGDKKGNVKERLKETLNIAERIRANADATLDPESITTLQGNISSTRAIRTNRKVAQRIEAGNGESVYERFGMRQFENSQALANGVFEDTFTPGMKYDEFANSVHGYYDSIYESQFSDVMSPEKFHEIIDNGVAKAYRYENPGPLAKVEQALAMEKAIYASEHIRYTDKATQRYVDYEVGHMLRNGKMPSTIGRAVANNISRTFYSGALGLNPLSAIQNFTELSRVAGLTATKDTLDTLKNQIAGATPRQINQTLKSYGIDSNRIRQEMTDAIPTAQKAIKAFQKGRDITEDTVMAAFNATETLKNYGMIKALEIKHADIADPRARREAIMDDFNANSLIGGHYGNLVGVDRSNLMRVAMQFGTYTMRDWGQIADRAKAGDVGYVARVLGTKAALAIPMYALFGTSLAYTLGINEFKGGPAVSLTTELINSIIEENNRVQSETEEGKKAEFDWGNVTSQFSKKATPLLVPGGNYMFNKLGVQDAIGLDPENKVFREDTFIGDMKKGFNSNKSGNPRFAAAEDPMSVIRGVIGGAYNTDEAREYFGKDFFAKPQLFGLFDTNTQKNSPAYGRFQERIENSSKVLSDPNASKEQKEAARATIRNTFDKAYESQDLRNEFFKDNAEAASIYKEMTKATFNKATGKRESDVISPEKWKYVDSEKSGKLFEFLKQRAIKNNENFGDPIDPIYTAELTEAQKKEVLNLRSSYTGDDKERKSMLYESQWYNDFQGKMSEYYKQMGEQTFDESSDYGNSPRKTEYIALQGAQPQRSDLYKQYQALRYGNTETGAAGDEEAGKAFYKANADALNADNEAYQRTNLEWTNKMRVLEGATPLTWEQFTNDTYGYKSGGSGNGYKQWGNGGKESTKTGAEDTITNFGNSASGPKKIKTSTPELVDVKKVVKQPQRANKKLNLRITI